MPRSLFADLLHKIDKGKPRLIVFDLVFSGESENKQNDILLAEAIEGKNNILFPYASDDAGRPLGSDDFFIKDLNHHPLYTIPEEKMKIMGNTIQDGSYNS